MRRAPQRLQLRRTKGWRKPPNSVVVTRPGVFGNPFRQLPGEDPALAVEMFRTWVSRLNHRDAYTEQRWALKDRLHELRGKNLLCWCKPGAPCHGDVLLELANRDQA